MNASSLHRLAPGLLAGVTVLLSCFLLLGCNYAVRTTTLFGDYRDQFPPVVLSVDKEDKIDYTFDWKETTVGGMSVSKFKPSQNFWRLNVFRFSDGVRIGGDDKWIPFGDLDDKNTQRSVTFPGLPVGKLLRFDLDLADDPKSPKDRETYNFMVLFHNE